MVWSKSLITELIINRYNHMKFSNISRYTTGADDLVGCLGIPNARSFNVETLLESVQDAKLFSGLTEKALKIVAHYGTEPPQSNFVAVTTFFNPFTPFNKINGAILGIDILKPKNGYSEFTAIENDLRKEINRDIKIYDLNPITTIIDKYMDHFPLFPGYRFFEANSEYSSLQINGHEKYHVKKLIESGSRIKCYAILSIGISNKNNCRLIMEDSGYWENGKEEELIKSSVKSILAVEKVERQHGLNITYDEIYLLTTFSDALKVDKNCIFSNGNGFLPVWSQCQFIYANPPKEICPPGLSIHKLKEISFEKWKECISDNNTLKKPIVEAEYGH